MAGLTEPVPGATPLDEDTLAGLIPTWVATRADLDAVENDGIQRAMLWVFNPRVRYAIEDLLTAPFADRLHHRMFGGVWRWAGQRRRRVTTAATLALWLMPTCTGAAWHLSGGVAST